jgi:WD40 repeat protein
MEGHRGSVTAACVTPDGKRAITGSWDGSSRIEDHTLRIWNLTKGQQEHVIDNGSWTHTLLLTRDGAYAMQGPASWGSQLSIWDMRTGARRHELPHRSFVTCLSLSPGGELLAHGGEDNSLRIWDWRKETEIAHFYTDEPVNLAEFTSDLTRLIVVSGGRRVHVFEIVGRKGRRRR